MIRQGRSVRLVKRAGTPARLSIPGESGLRLERGRSAGSAVKMLGAHAQAAGFAGMVLRGGAKNFDLWLVATKTPVSNDRLVELLNRFTRQ